MLRILLASFLAASLFTTGCSQTGTSEPTSPTESEIPSTKTTPTADGLDKEELAIVEAFAEEYRSLMPRMPWERAPAFRSAARSLGNSDGTVGQLAADMTKAADLLDQVAESVDSGLSSLDFEPTDIVWFPKHGIVAADFKSLEGDAVELVSTEEALPVCEWCEAVLGEVNELVPGADLIFIQEEEE